MSAADGYRPPHPGSLEWWIQRVDAVVQEATQSETEPLLSKAAVIAWLRQAQALELIAQAFGAIAPPPAAPLPPIPFDCRACQQSIAQSEVLRILVDLVACPYCGAVYSAAVLTARFDFHPPVEETAP